MRRSGATSSPRSGAEAGRTPCPKDGGQEELPHVQSRGQRRRVPDCNCAGTAERSYFASKVGGAAKRRYPTSEVRGSGPECQAAMEQEWLREDTQRPRSGAAPGGDTPRPKPKARGGGQEEQPHARGQGQWLGGPTPGPRSRSCAGAGGPRGDIPCCRSGRTAVRRYPSSKVRSNGCALLEQL